MVPVFAYYADLESRHRRPPGEFFDRLAERVLGWAAADYGPDFAPAADGLTREPAAGHTVAAVRTPIDAGHDLFTLDWAYPGEEPGVRLVCRTELARTPLGVQLAVTLSAGRSGHAVAPVRASAYRPAVLDALADEADALAGGEPVPDAVRVLTDRFVPGFLDDCLLNPNRALPVVVLSPRPETGQPIVPPERVLDELYGLAHVVELAHVPATFAITHRLGKEWSCFYGAVRVYWPGAAAAGDEFRRHPIYFPDHYPPGAEDRLLADLFRRIAAAAAVRFADPPKVRLAREAADRRRQDEERRRVAELTAGAAEAKELMRGLESAWDEATRLRDELAAARAEAGRLRDELAAQQEQWAGFERELDELKRSADRERAAADRLRQRLVAGLRTVADAVELAKADFADVLAFLPTADRSAAESPFQHPDRVYELFRGLAEIMRGVRANDGSLGTGMFEALKRYGFEYKDKISQTSATRYGRDYTFRYDGRDVLFQNHVTLGSGPPRSCLSVHWLRDDGRRVFAIGHCGRHLTNTMS